MKYKFNFYFFLVILMISPNIALAYLDPVTGLVIFQAIIAFIATIYATIILKPIRFIKKIFNKKDKDQSNSKDKNNSQIEKK